MVGTDFTPSRETGEAGASAASVSGENGDAVKRVPTAHFAGTSFHTFPVVPVTMLRPLVST